MIPDHLNLANYKLHRLKRKEIIMLRYLTRLSLVVLCLMSFRISHAGDPTELSEEAYSGVETSSSQSFSGGSRDTGEATRGSAWSPQGNGLTSNFHWNNDFFQFSYNGGGKNDFLPFLAMLYEMKNKHTRQAASPVSSVSSGRENSDILQPNSSVVLPNLTPDTSPSQNDQDEPTTDTSPSFPVSFPDPAPLPEIASDSEPTGTLPSGPVSSAGAITAPEPTSLVFSMIILPLIALINRKWRCCSEGLKDTGLPSEKYI
jgi:hypothetical protein